MLDLFALESGVHMQVYMDFECEVVMVFMQPLQSLTFGLGPELRCCKSMKCTKIITGCLNHCFDHVENRSTTAFALKASL